MWLALAKGTWTEVTMCCFKPLLLSWEEHNLVSSLVLGEGREIEQSCSGSFPDLRNRANKQSPAGMDTPLTHPQTCELAQCRWGNCPPAQARPTDPPSWSKLQERRLLPYVTESVLHWKLPGQSSHSRPIALGHFLTKGRNTSTTEVQARLVFIVRSDVEAETPKLWPPDVKSWLIGKDPDTGKDWGQKEKRTAESEMVGWHHRLNGHGFG